MLPDRGGAVGGTEGRQPAEAMPLPLRTPWRRSIRTRIIAWFFVPTALILAAVAATTFYAYQDVTEDLVVERDRAVTRLSAAQLAGSLSEFSDLLEEVSRAVAPSLVAGSGHADGLRAAFGPLAVFDGGVRLLDTFGAVISVEPSDSGVQGEDWSDREIFRTIIHTPRPAFSNIISAGPDGGEAVAIVVPVIGAQGEFLGAVVGMFKLGATSVSALYGRIVRLRVGESGSFQLLDQTGRAIYHSDVNKTGEDFSDQPAVRELAGRGSGAIRTTSFTGEDIVAGFAPVPGTPWSLVTEESWSVLTSGSRGYQRFLLLLLVVGVVLPAAIVAVGLRRLMRPVDQLTAAAREVGGGNLDVNVNPSKMAGELEVLSTAFNQMTGQLRGLVGELEQRVAERTAELVRRASQLEAAARVASEAVAIHDVDQLLSQAVLLIRERLGYYNVNIYLLEHDSGQLVLRAVAGGYVDEVPVGTAKVRLGEGIVGWVGKTAEAILANDVSQEPKYSFVEALQNTKAELAVPIKSGEHVQGVLDSESTEIGAFDQTDQITLQAIANLLGVAIENAQLFQQTHDVAVLEERNRMAREIHDTLAQGFTAIVLQLEAAEQVLDGGSQEAEEHLGRAKNQARESLQEARRSVWNLLPKALEERSLDAALQEEVLRFASVGREKASFGLSGNNRELSGDVQAALLRICQESLTNIRRHAKATEVHVTLTFYADAVDLCIQDNGLGFDWETAKGDNRQGGYGLVGMEARAHLLGGTFSVKTGNGQGTIVEARMPTA